MSIFSTLRRKRLEPGWLSARVHADGMEFALVEPAPSGPRLLWVSDVLDDAAQAAAIRAERLARRRLTLLLPGGSYQLIQMNAPAVPRAEWKAAVRWMLKDYIDFPVETAIYDVFEIPVARHAPGRPSLVFVAVAAQAQLQPLVARCDALGLALCAIDIPEMALRNVASLLETENRGLALLAFDAGGGLLTISFQGELYASRRVEIPLAQLADADVERRQALFERIGLELQRSLDAFDRQYSFIPVERLLLAPRPELSGLLDYLASILYVPVESLDLGAAIDCSACPELRQPVAQARHLLCIGAALREEPPA
jgi:MSHA biogenesis protein MshI